MQMVLTGKSILHIPRGYKTCWNCKTNHVSVMSKSMALKKFSKKLDFKGISTRTGVENHSIFFSLTREGNLFHHKPMTKVTDRTTRRTEYFWYPDLEDRALAEGWIPRGKKEDEVPWVRKDLSYKRAVVAKKQMPTKRKRKTNSSAPETPRKSLRKAAPVTPEDAKPRL